VARTPQNVTDAEWAILDVLWNQGPATVRHLTEVLYPSGSASEHGTVYKLLERLEAKGCVKRARSGGVYEFRATVARDEVIGRELEALVEKMCGGSLQPLLSNLVRVKRLTPVELRELLALVDSLDLKSKSKKDRKK
jgi:BlaI family transcriptional regulator, penicillinase repressor